MRFIHTSDWHLGRLFHERSRIDAQSQFLRWLLDEIRENNVEFLIVSGDVFDTISPPTAAQELYYDFFADLPGTGCRLAVVVGGNHDSANFLNAPAGLLAKWHVYVAGGGTEEDEVIAVPSSDGTPAALILAIPFLKERDLRSGSLDETVEGREKRIVEATAARYAAGFAKAEKIREEAGNPDIPIIATGHLLVSGSGKLGTEQDLYIGGLGNVAPGKFPSGIDYLALGHIHKPCCVVDDRKSWNYCGAPMIFDFSEMKEKRYVNLVETSGRECRVERITVPEFDRVESVRGTEDEIRERLAELAKEGEKILAEAVLTGGGSSAGLAERLQTAIRGTSVDLLRVRVEAKAASSAADDEVSGDADGAEMNIADISPEDMFRIFLKENEDKAPRDSWESLEVRYDELLDKMRHDEKTV